MSTQPVADPWQQRYLRRCYYGDRGWVDGTTEFHNLCQETIPPGSRILEVGAGPANPTSRFLATLGELHGTDPDPEVMGNDALAFASILDGDALPYDSAMFDACVSDHVAEHVGDPEVHLKEVLRVLKPGAPYDFRTPNLRHFVYGVASRTPHWFYAAVANRLRNLPPDAHDPYPTG